MNHMHTPGVGWLAACAILIGCNTDEVSDVSTSSSGTTGAVKLVVAPLEVDSRADYACYDIVVSDAAGDEVWSIEHACSNTWGLGVNGTFTFVGVCDASAGGSSSVSIALTSLIADDGSELGNWDPAAPPTFEADFTCIANADAVVRAEFVVITQGEVGFIDVQVEVEEIACNAKVDCNDDLLGGDVGTIIVGLACDASGAVFTELMLDAITLTCNDEAGAEVVVLVDPSVGLGAHPGYPQGFVSGCIGNAGVLADGSSFWTLAIGVSPGFTNCRLDAAMAANDGRDMGDNDRFPIIRATNISFGFEADVFSCQANPLDGAASGLVSTWGSGEDLDFLACLSADGSVGLCL